MGEAGGRDIAYWGDVIPKDASALADAYHKLLITYYDGDGIDLVNLNITALIYQYVTSMLRRGGSTQWRIWTVVEDAMKFLWFVHSRKGKTPGILRTPIGLHVAMLLDTISFLQREHTKTDEEKLIFAKMIKETDLLALAGCTLLLGTDIGTWHDNLPWTWSSEAYDQLCVAFDQSISIAPHLFEESLITWTKVLDQVQICYEIGHLSTRDYDLIMNAWPQFGIILGAQFVPRIQKCAYPRCFQGGVDKGSLGVRLVCGTCGLAIYCSHNCQRAHWQLKTVDSHRLECAPFKLVPSLTEGGAFIDSTQ
ncbi:hypothetical protein BDV93DRAFT_526766 [Ceratobasidium sp. AG-I]|nr:hypothetical protein BDV93DRAFT_526766 [Ceratobasidium sp. AG-I]